MTGATGKQTLLILRIIKESRTGLSPQQLIALLEKDNEEISPQSVRVMLSGLKRRGFLNSTKFPICPHCGNSFTNYNITEQGLIALASSPLGGDKDDKDS